MANHEKHTFEERVSKALEYLKRNWSIIVASVSFLGCLVCLLVPQLRKPEYVTPFIFGIANTIFWTLVDIKLKLFPVDSAKVTFESLPDATGRILENLRELTFKNRKNQLEINIISGKAGEIFPILQNFFTEIANNNTKAVKNVTFTLYCINPNFLNSLDLSRIYDQSFSFSHNKDRINTYKDYVTYMESEIRQFSNHEQFLVNNIKIELILYNAYPNFYAFMIGDKYIYWGNFTWVQKEFKGSLNPCNFLSSDSSSFATEYKLLTSEISFFKDSTRIFINMQDNKYLYDYRQVSSLNKLAYDNLVQDYVEKNQLYKTQVSELNRRDQLQELSQYLFTQISTNLSAKNSDISILEIGPGAGYLTELLSKRNYKIDAIEFSDNFYNYLNKQSIKNLNLIKDDFLQYRADKFYDVLLAISFIHLYPSVHLGLIFQKIRTVLKKRGIAYISTSLHEFSNEGYFRKDNASQFVVRYRKLFTKEELEYYITSAHFEILDSYTKVDMLDSNKTWMAYLIRKK